MKRTRTLGLVALFALLIALHYLVRPFLAWRAPIDFLCIGVLLVAVRIRPGNAALLGFAAGLTADALAPGSFGAAAIAMTVIGFGASWLKAAFFDEHVVINAIFLFLGKLGFDALFLMMERRLQGGALWSHLAVWSSLSALLTALAGLAMLALFRPMIESREGRP